jgi:Cof subfamily protein (haloacid dehalogenase superfamily)
MTDAVVPDNLTIAAVLADVDGTLVTASKELTPRAIEVVKQLHTRGVLFAITSGRPPRGMRMLVDPLELRGPIAAFNGGMIVQPDMTVVEERLVAADVAAEIAAAIHQFGLDVWVYSGTEWYVTDPRAPHVARETATVQFEPTGVPSYTGLLDRVVKIVGVSDDFELVARCETSIQVRFGSRVSAARSQPYYLDVTHPAANKGAVVERLASYYKIPLEHVATIGDQPNDTLMFRRSGLSIAMGNASPDVQHQATCVTASNEDEGFARAMEEYVLPHAASYESSQLSDRA